MHVVGLSVSGTMWRLDRWGFVPLFEAHWALASFGHPAGLPGDPSAKRSLLCSTSAGNPQIVMSAVESGMTWLIPETVIVRP